MSNSFYIDLGKKIYNLRKEKKLSREKFAEMAGINDYYLGEIERGEKKASLDTLFKISKILKLQIHELIKID
jgi:transcriptional regulator with XRE-family HTH domain